MHTLNELPATPSVSTDLRPARRVRATIARKSFSVLSTFSPAGHAHAAGVVHVFDGDHLWTHTMRSSRKARNVEANSNVGVCVTVRRLPVGPPFTISFQGIGKVFAMDAPEVSERVESGLFKPITSHGELDADDGCFLRVTPRGRLHTYGLGVSLVALLHDPLNTGAGSVSAADWEATR